MPSFMDVHNIEGGVSAADVAGAHKAYLEAPGAHGVNYQHHWVDERAGKVFRMVESAYAETANSVHREAHGSEPTSPASSTATAGRPGPRRG